MLPFKSHGHIFVWGEYIVEFVIHCEEFLLELVKRRTVSQLNELHEASVALAREQFGSLHLAIWVSNGDKVCYGSFVQEILFFPQLLESHLLPFECVKRVLLFKLHSCWYDFDILHDDGVESWHKFAWRKFNPALLGVSNDNHLSM